MEHIIKLQTTGCILRPLVLSDAKEYLACHADTEAQANFSSIPTTLVEAKKEISHKIKKQKSFAIMQVTDFAGFINLELNNHPRYKHSAVIGYGLKQEFRGKGIATAAVKAVTAYAFKELKLKRVTGWCRTHNKASARVLEKAGYKLEGILKKNKFKDGKYLDDMIWAKVK